MLRKALIVAVLVCFSVSGCANLFGSGGDDTNTLAASASAMSVEAAGAYYLATVCPANAETEAFTTAMGSPTATVESLQAAGAAFQKSNLTAAEKLEKPDVVWPDSVAEDIALIANQMRSFAAFAEGVSQSTTIEEAHAGVPAVLPGAKEAGPKVRKALGLSADYEASCAP